MSISSRFALAGVLTFATALGSNAASLTGLARLPSGSTMLVERVHSAYGAEQSLYARGYYDIRLERPTLPYSFNACKRGLRYHVHVNYYGDLVHIDEVGPCRGYGYNRRRDYGRYRYDY